MESIQVAYYPVTTEFGGGVGIDHQALAGGLRANRGAPYPRPRIKELGCQVAFFRMRLLPSLKSNRQSAQVSDIFPDSEGAVDVYVLARQFAGAVAIVLRN